MTTRRTFLLGSGVAAAGTLVPAPAAAAPDIWAGGRPDAGSHRFTVAVIPDTQYLFDMDRGDSEPLDAALRYLLEHAGRDNIVFVGHLGDLTENGLAGEIDGISRSFEVLDRRRVGYSVLAGNHDLDARTDDQRGRTPYLDAFGPHRFRRSPTFRGASPDGYNSCHVFPAGGRQWLVLALDWRMSAKGFAWAREVIARNPRLPVILTTHELVYAAESGQAELSDYGRRLWDELIKGTDQIFLTINGHFWPPGRTVLANGAGNEVHLHITNYQDRYYGGSAMIRLYQFDLARNVIDVRTFSPWLLGKKSLNTLERQEIERTGDVDRFSVPIDFAARFGGFDPVPVRPARPAQQMIIRGTVAYWRPDSLKDLSGNGNDLRQVGTLSATGDHHPDSPSHASRFFDKAGYLSTVDSAPLNRMTFDRGYTIETFIKLPQGFNHPWCGLLTTLAPGAAAGKSGDDPKEPIGTLNLSGGGGLQWAVFPRNQNGISTNWGHELDEETWWHVAVVNDGRHTTLFVEGSRLLRTPSTPATGISTVGDPWLVGAYAYDRIIEKSYHGWLGELRIVDHALPSEKFLTAR